MTWTIQAPRIDKYHINALSSFLVFIWSQCCQRWSKRDTSAFLLRGLIVNLFGDKELFICCNDTESITLAGDLGAHVAIDIATQPNLLAYAIGLGLTVVDLNSNSIVADRYIMQNVISNCDYTMVYSHIPHILHKNIFITIDEFTPNLNKYIGENIGGIVVISQDKELHDRIISMGFEFPVYLFLS